MNTLTLFFNVLFNKNFIINLFLLSIFVGISLIFFQKTFKVHFSKQNIFIYVLANITCLFIGFLLSNYIYSYFLIAIASLLLSISHLKISTLYSFTYFSLKSILCLNIHFFIFKFSRIILPYTSYFEIIELPFFNMCSIILFSMLTFFIHFIFQYFKIDIFFKTFAETKSNSIISISILNLIIIFLIFSIFFETFSQNLIYILILNVYFYFSIINIILLFNKLYLTQKIANLSLCNKSISSLHDNMRAFKHDFHNIIQSIGGYIAINDIDGLKNYYSQISNDCKDINNLSNLNPELINNPAIYNLLADKYYIALNNNIHISLEIMLNLNSLNMKIYEFTRILGILLDNAIEASKECNTKNINIYFKKDINKQLVIIENTYNNKNISVEKIFEKNYTTKLNNSGLGLWQVRKILNKNSNINLHTTKNNDYFSQQLEIYTT